MKFNVAINLTSMQNFFICNGSTVVLFHDVVYTLGNITYILLYVRESQFFFFPSQDILFFIVFLFYHKYLVPQLQYYFTNSLQIV